MPHYFFSKLIPPRPTFAQDMNDDERRLMAEHADYWKRQAEKGVALLFGPVADPKGGYGICVTQVDKEEDILRITAADPVILSGANFRFETCPMPNVVRSR
jgi:uncharacterized protein YciI